MERRRSGGSELFETPASTTVVVRVGLWTLDAQTSGDDIVVGGSRRER